MASWNIIAALILLLITAMNAVQVAKASQVQSQLPVPLISAVSDAERRTGRKCNSVNGPHKNISERYLRPHLRRICPITLLTA